MNPGPRPTSCRSAIISLIWFGGESRPDKYGIDFSKNLATNFEIHGELSHTPEQEKKVLSEAGTNDAYDEFEDTGETAPLMKAQKFAQGAYGKPQSGRDYLYIKTTQKEPFDLLYTTPGLTAIINIEDKSYSISPEITYTGFTNWELRLRLTHIDGGRFTEYGEKQNESKGEIRVRFFF